MQPLNMAMSPPIPGVRSRACLPGVQLVEGSTMYLAGTPYANGAPSFTCQGAKGETLTCGELTIFDLSTMSVMTSGIAITDGYHNRIAMAANGQLFIGARTCTEMIPPLPIQPGDEIRGCLSSTTVEPRGLAVFHRAAS